MTNPSLLKGFDGRMIAQGILCHLYCRQTKTIDISVTNLDGFKAWLMDIPFANFCIGIQNLKANTECSINTVMCKFVAEWSATDSGLVLAYKGGQIDLSSGRAGALGCGHPGADPDHPGARRHERRDL